MRKSHKFYKFSAKVICVAVALLTFQNCGEFQVIPGLSSSDGSRNGGSGGVPGDGTGTLSSYSIAKSLSREESLNAAKDLVGPDLISEQMVYLLPPDEKTAGFESVTSKLFSEAYVGGRFKFSEAVAEAALSSSRVMTCNPGFLEVTPWTGCLQTIVRQFASRAFSRAPSDEELASWQQIYQGTVRATAPFLGVNLLGAVDQVSPNLEVQGWSLDPQWSDRPIQIQFFVDGPAGTGTLAGSTVTRIPRPDVISYYQRTAQVTYTGNHGFSFQLPTGFANGQPRTLHLYAIGGDGTTGRNVLIGTTNFRANSATPINNAVSVLSASTREGLKNALISVLMSPAFQLRESPQLPAEPNIKFQNRRLARRLALFLSGTLPDAALLQAAEQADFSSPEVLRAHATRILDQNLSRFVFNSFGQWFGFRDFSRVTSLTSIEQAMVLESQLVFEEVVRLNLPFDSILMPGFTFLNRDLASNYGIGSVTSSSFVKVNQQQRGGVLTQGSTLRLTSPTDNTKVVQRGKWIMSNLLCQIIPSPDNSLREMIGESVSQVPENATVKETLAFHRSRGPACMACHRQMDPLGLSLEVFDPFGRTRTTYPDGKRVEADGNLNGTAFDGPYQLAPLIVQQNFNSCVTRKLLTHALGREVQSFEDLLVVDLANSRGLKDLILRIATSQMFIDESRRNQ